MLHCDQKHLLLSAKYGPRFADYAQKWQLKLILRKINNQIMRIIILLCKFEKFYLLSPWLQLAIAESSFWKSSASLTTQYTTFAVAIMQRFKKLVKVL